MWQTAMTLPQFPWGVPKDLQPILPARGLLGRAEVAVLNAMVGKTVEARAAFVPNVPKALILALTDGGGLPIAGADVEVFQTTAAGLSTEAVYKKKSTSNGYVVLGSTDGKGPFADLSPDGSNSWYLVRVTREFVTETAWLPATNVIAEAARGNAAPTVELRLMMGSGEIKTDDDLAAGKFVTDSMGRFPAELTAVVDGDPSTSVEVTPGDKPYTLDIDLGRDRLIAAVEIETTGDLWDTFDISVSKTGQKGEFEPWFKEGAGAMRLAERGQASGANKVVTYLATAVRARTLRLTVKSGNKVNLAAIRVRSLKQG